MYSTKDYIEITKEYILSRISEFEIFQYYIPNLYSIGKKFSSPFRTDNDPSCCIKSYGDGLIFRDFATGENYTAISLVSALYFCDYRTALNKIASDFNLKELKIDLQLVESQVNKVKSSVAKEKVSIQIKVRKWIKELDYQYWVIDSGISLKTLNFFKVFPISEFWINSYNFKCKTSTYAYYYGNQEFKILNPNKEGNGKWYSNTSYDTLQGYNQLPETGDLLIITSSLKDAMRLYEMGYNSIAPTSETGLLPKEAILELESRFTQLVLFYDNDGTFTPNPGESGKGKYGALKNSQEYKIPMIFLPDGEEKDITDYYKKNGNAKTIQIMQKLLNEE